MEKSGRREPPTRCRSLPVRVELAAVVPLRLGTLTGRVDAQLPEAVSGGGQSQEDNQEGNQAGHKVHLFWTAPEATRDGRVGRPLYKVSLRRQTEGGLVSLAMDR